MAKNDGHPAETSSSKSRTIDAVEIFRRAFSFHKAAGRLYRAQQEDSDVKAGGIDMRTLEPQCALRAFAAELYIKAGFAAENDGQLARGHNLETLFGRLSENLRAQVLTKVKQAEESDPLHRISRSLPGGQDDFQVRLHRNRNAFEEYRYAYETDGMIDFQIGCFPVALYLTLAERYPQFVADDSWMFLPGKQID